MPRSCTTTLRLFGAFTVEVNAGRPIAVVPRSKKARALLAYLAMAPDWRASREELATLFWGDTPDAQARHSLRQCLMSLRQDLHLAPELFWLDRDTVELRAQGLAVDARELVRLCGSTQADDLERAAALWRGPFLADLWLDTEEFDAWRQRQQERLADAAARVFGSLCALADAAGDGERALAAAERLVALDPTREDRQRTALRLCARYRGRDAALERARALTSLLRTEVAAPPDADTRALIDAIRTADPSVAAPGVAAVQVRSEPGQPAEPPAPAAERRDLQVREPQSNFVRPLALPVAAPGHEIVSPALLASAPARLPVAAARRALWRRRPLAAALALVGAVSFGAVAVLELAAGLPIPWSKMQNEAGSHRLASVVVLPFSVEASGDAQDPAFARLLTHDLTANLTRYGDLRIISDRTAGLYGDRVDVASLGSELAVRYAIVGHLQRSNGALRASIQLVDAATRTTLWSDHIGRAAGEPAPVANDFARGLARVLVINIAYAEAQRLRTEAGKPAELRDILLRARVAEMHGYLRENLATALRLYEEALHRAPRNASAILGVARIHIVATMNFVDLDTPPDLKHDEGVLRDVLRRFPESVIGHYTLALLQKRQRQYEASLQSLQRVLELNPSFLPARAQIGAVLTRMGQPEKGLEAIRETMRLATDNDPGRGFWYLFAGEAELQLGHQQAALEWMRRADTFMPGSALVQAWLASVYAVMGDRPNTEKYVAALRSLAPAGAQRFAERKFAPAVPPNGWPRTRIIEGLRAALAGSLG